MNFVSIDIFQRLEIFHKLQHFKLNFYQQLEKKVKASLKEEPGLFLDYFLKGGKKLKKVQKKDLRPLADTMVDYLEGKNSIKNFNDFINFQFGSKILSQLYRNCLKMLEMLIKKSIKLTNTYDKPTYLKTTEFQAKFCPKNILRS